MALRLIRGERTADLEIVRSAEVALFKFGWSEESVTREVPVSVRLTAFVDGLTFALTGRRGLDQAGYTHRELIERAIKVVREAAIPLDR